MEILVQGVNVCSASTESVSLCVSHYQDGCGSYCNCHCNGDH